MEQTMQELARKGTAIATTLQEYVQTSHRRIEILETSLRETSDERDGLRKELIEALANHSAVEAGAAGTTPLLDALESAIFSRFGAGDDYSTLLRKRGWTMASSGVGWKPPADSKIPAAVYPLPSAFNRQRDEDLRPFKHLLRAREAAKV